MPYFLTNPDIWFVHAYDYDLWYCQLLAGRPLLVDCGWFSSAHVICRVCQKCNDCIHLICLSRCMQRSRWSPETTSSGSACQDPPRSSSRLEVNMFLDFHWWSWCLFLRHFDHKSEMLVDKKTFFTFHEKKRNDLTSRNLCPPKNLIISFPEAGEDSSLASPSRSNRWDVHCGDLGKVWDFMIEINIDHRYS